MPDEWEVAGNRDGLIAQALRDRAAGEDGAGHQVCHAHDTRSKRAAHALEKYFGFNCMAEPTDANVVLTDNAGLVLTISNFDHADQVTYPKWFHVGFMQDSDDKVDDIYDRLKAAGMHPGKPQDMHGARTFYFTAPGGFTVEVFHQRGLSRSEGR